MPVVGFDHVVLPTSDAVRFVDFYKRLGFSIIDEDKWRRGEVNRFAIQIGQSKINVHPPGANGRDEERHRHSRLRGPVLRMGRDNGGGAPDDCGSRGRDRGRPVPRRGGRNAGQTTATSVYVRDPDGNLLEFMVYD